jgi:hypothetical protein
MEKRSTGESNILSLRFNAARGRSSRVLRSEWGAVSEIEFTQRARSLPNVTPVADALDERNDCCMERNDRHMLKTNSEFCNVF